MTCKLFRHTATAFLTLLVSGALTCCYDYDELAATGKEESAEGFGLAFDIAVNTVPGGLTRATDDNHIDHTDVSGDGIDSQIDVDGATHDFRVLLFDQNDQFLFEPTRDNKEYALWDMDGYDYDSDNNYDSGVNTRRWRIRIPATVLQEKGVLDEIKDNSFKIAILANWPKDKKVTFAKGDDLSKLSHYYGDETYTDNAEAYYHLPATGNLMGGYTEWVENAYGNQDVAEAAIRVSAEGAVAPCTIKRNFGTREHTYRHIWRVWNFGTFDEDLKSISDTPAIVGAWKTKLEKDYEAFVGEWGADEQEKAADAFSNYGGFYDGEDDGLTFDEPKEVGGFTSAFLKNGGFRLAQGLTATENSNKTQYITQNRLKFTAFAQGTLRIWAKKASAACTLGVQTKDNNSTNNTSNRKTAELTDDFKCYEFKNIAVTGAGSDKADAPFTIPEIVSIYAVGGAMIVKQIEYIESKHLYDTDRKGILPQTDGHLIPMYGIQEYTAIGKYVVPGGTLNLSTLTENVDNGYPRKKLYLLRSVAKVELLIPNNMPQLSHVYMRSANRTGRCEPMDVSTPTNQLWNKVDPEIDHIREYGAFYDGNDKSVANYRNRLSWFYGAWTQWKTPWKWNGKGVTVPTTDYDFPHIFNSRIGRSDYVHFIYKGEENGNHRYVLYVPEKSIDDPTTAGDMSSTPKIPHIELRFEGINNDENLDDNDCYRIYFTDRNDLIPSRSNTYDNEELYHLGKLYPIVRNHIYRFTVLGSVSQLEVNVDVVPYDDTQLDPEFGLGSNEAETDGKPYDDSELNPGAGHGGNSGETDGKPYDDSDLNPGAGNGGNNGETDGKPYDDSDLNPGAGSGSNESETDGTPYDDTDLNPSFGSNASARGQSRMQAAPARGKSSAWKVKKQRKNNNKKTARI